MIAALGVGSLPNRRRRSLSRRVVCNSAPRCLHDAPSSEVVVVGGLPRQEEVVRKQPPGAPSPEHIEDGVQELARLMSSGASARLGFGHEMFEDTPFVIGEVCGVGSTGRHGTAAPSRFGSRILRALTPSQTPSYISESAPTDVRGSLSSLFQLAITIGILVAYLVNAAFASAGEWRWPLGLAFAPPWNLLTGMNFRPGPPAGSSAKTGTRKRGGF